MSAALQVYSRDFDADFFKLPAAIQARIESAVDRLGAGLDTHPHHRMNLPFSAAIAVQYLKIDHFREDFP